MLLKNLRPVSGFLFRVSKYLPRSILLLLYNSYVNSKLSYCLDSWGNAPHSHLNKILLFQKRIIRIINKKPIAFPTKQLFISSNILKIDNMYAMKVLCKAHSAFHSHSIPTHSYPTRASSINIPIPLFKSTAGQRTEAYREAVLWNSLPIELRQITKIGQFRTALRHHLLA